MAREAEEYLLKKLETALGQPERTEACLSKVLFDIQTRFKNVHGLLQDAKEKDLSGDGESNRREKLYYLLNAHEEWQMVLERKSVYTPEGLHFAGALNRKLKEMESKLGGKSKTGGGSERASVTSHQGGTGNLSIIKISDGKSENERKGSESFIYRWSSRTVNREEVKGFTEKENFMERFLIRRDNEMNGFKAIGIFGVAGVGKTTLCQLTFSNKKVMENFSPRIWVCMSKQTEDVDGYSKEVIERILKCLGVEDEVIEYTAQNRGLRGLLFALHRALKGRRYLIVLDDAFHSDGFFENLLCSESKWDDSCPEKLAHGLPRQQGGAVIVTTRSEQLAKKMVGKENVHPLLPLKDKKSCQEIFSHSAGGQVMQLLKDETLKTIVSKSGGLPWAAKMMGQIMKEEELAKRQQTQQQ